MGLLLDTIAFQYPAPRAEDIAVAATRMCGLQVCVKHNEPSRHQEYNANLYFDGFPQHGVSVYTYIQGAIRAFEEETFRNTGHHSSIRCQGYDDADVVQSVYIQSYLESENTLFQVLALTVRKFEGCLEDDESNELKGLKNLSSEIMTERHQQFLKAHEKRMPWYVAHIIIMLILSPFWILWVLIKMPFAYLKIRRLHPELFNK